MINENLIEQIIYPMVTEIIDQLGPDAAAMLAQAILNIINDTNNTVIQREPVYKKGSKLTVKELRNE